MPVLDSVVKHSTIVLAPKLYIQEFHFDINSLEQLILRNSDLISRYSNRTQSYDAGCQERNLSILKIKLSMWSPPIQTAWLLNAEMSFLLI